MFEVVNEFELPWGRAAVWGLLMDTPRYATWNPKLVRVEGAFRAGEKVTLHYVQNRAWMPSRFLVDVDACDEGRELRWSGPQGLGRLLLRASHYFRLSDGPDGEGTRLVHGERFAGLLSVPLQPVLKATVEAGHRTVNDALVKRCGQPATTLDEST